MSKEQVISIAITYISRMSETAFELSKMIYNNGDHHIYDDLKVENINININLPAFNKAVSKLIKSKLDMRSSFTTKEIAIHEVSQAFIIIQLKLLESYLHIAFEPSTLQEIFKIMNDNNYSQFQNLKNDFLLEDLVMDESNDLKRRVKEFEETSEVTKRLESSEKQIFFVPEYTDVNIGGRMPLFSPSTSAQSDKEDKIGIHIQPPASIVTLGNDNHASDLDNGAVHSSDASAGG